MTSRVHNWRPISRGRIRTGLRRRSAVGLIAALALASSLPAVGFAAAPLNQAALGASAAKALAVVRIPGAALMIVDRGRVVFDKGFGVANVTTHVPVTSETRFEIGSVTKQFAAAAILQLQEEGKLSLHDTLGKYVPQYRQGRNVTLEQLLGQVSGIPNYTSVPHFEALSSTKPRGFATILALISKKPLEFKPGTHWAYSNTNYFLLGRVIELVSNVSWHRYAREHLFATAGMTHSGFIGDEQKLANMATGYELKKGAFKRSPLLVDEWAFSAGDIVSTVGDLAKWDDAYFAGKVISAADVVRATTPGRLANGQSTGYGFGWQIDSFDGQHRISHDGGTNGFTSQNSYYPALHEDIIVLENSSDADPEQLAAVTFNTLHPSIAAIEQRAAPGENRKVTALAQRIWKHLMSGTVDRSEFTPTMAHELTPEAIADGKSQFAPLGAPSAWIFRGKHAEGGDTGYEYHVSFSSGLAFNVHVAVTKDGKVDDYSPTPS